MLWWFEREGKHTQIEVLHLVTGKYELRVVEADGQERVEHFADPVELAKRQQAIQDELVSLGWKRSGEWLL